MKKNQFWSWAVLGIFVLALGLVAIPRDVQAVTAGSVVGSTTTNAAESMSFQRKSFFAQNQFWVFYVKPPNIVFRTSPDGIGWSAEKTMRSGNASSGDQFSVWSDGTSIYYAFTTGGAGTPIYFRKGTLNGGGTITPWANGEVQAVVGVGGVSYGLPAIAVDTGGRAWIGYRKLQGTTYPMITKNNNTNGIWAPAPGFPYTLGSPAAAMVVAPVPLDSGKMVTVYATVGQIVRARSWNGNTLIGGFTTVQASGWLDFSVVGNGDDVHLAFLNGTTLFYSKYNIVSNTITPEEVVAGGVTTESAPVLSIDSFKDVHLFYAKNNHIYYKQNSGGKWDASALDLVYESVEPLSSTRALTAPFLVDTNTGKIVFYLTKTSNPFNVKSSRGASSISIKKTGPTAAFIGDTIAYRFEIKNTGINTLTNVFVTDPALSYTSSAIASLAGGASASPINVPYTIPDGAPSVFVNSAVVSGTEPLQASVMDRDDWAVKLTNPLEVKKTAPQFVFDGSQITYTMTVKNVWIKNLTITSITDNLGTPIGPTGDNGDGKLNPGETWTYTLTIPTPNNMSPLINTVTVAAKGEDRVISGTATAKMYPVTISQDVVDSQDGTEFDVRLKEYTMKDLASFKIKESQSKKIWLGEGTYFFEEAIMYPSCYRLVPDSQYEVKYYPQYNNEFARITYVTGRKSDWTFFTRNICKICIDKSGPATACNGDTIQYTIQVTNCGESPLSNVMVADPLVGLNQNIGDLAAGASRQFSVNYSIQQTGSLENMATASGQYGAKTVTASASHLASISGCGGGQVVGQICGFKFWDVNGDGVWNIDQGPQFYDEFNNLQLDGWGVHRGQWAEAGGALKQTDAAAGNPNDPLILYEAKKYHALSYRTSLTPMEGNRDVGLVFFAQDDTHYFLFRVDGANGLIGVYRRDGGDYLKIIDQSLADAGITFPVENGNYYGMKVNSWIKDDRVDFYFDKLSNPREESNTLRFSLALQENFGCSSGYLGLRTHMSSVNFDWAAQSAEPGLEGWTIQLNGPVSQSTITGADGSYCFSALPPGTYTVSEVMATEWVQTYPGSIGSYQVPLQAGQSIGCVNFGNAAVLPSDSHKVVYFQNNKKGAVSVVFDDGYSSQVNIGAAELNARNLKGTFFVLTNDWWIIGHVPWATWLDVANQGHEIGSHAVDHLDLSLLPEADVRWELSESQRLINANISSQTCVSLAYPYGASSDAVDTLASEYYIGARGSWTPEGGNLNHYEGGRDSYNIWSPVNFSNISGWGVDPQTTIADLDYNLNLAEDRHAWLVPFFHSPEYISIFPQILDHLLTRDVWVDTFGNIVRYMRERLSSTLAVVSDNSSEIRLYLLHSLDPSVYNLPLTLRSLVPAQWTQVRVQQGSLVQVLTPVVEGAETAVYYNAIPNGEEIVLSPAP